MKRKHYRLRREVKESLALVAFGAFLLIEILYAYSLHIGL